MNPYGQWGKNGWLFLYLHMYKTANDDFWGAFTKSVAMRLRGQEREAEIRSSWPVEKCARRSYSSLPKWSKYTPALTPLLRWLFSFIKVPEKNAKNSNPSIILGFAYLFRMQDVCDVMIGQHAWTSALIVGQMRFPHLSCFIMTWN